MKTKRKTWKEKMLGRTTPEVVPLEKPFCGASAGSKMLIATPKMVQDFVFSIPPGENTTVRQMRDTLARSQGADIACPTSSSIFLRIVAEAAWEEHLEGKPVEALPPFWRVVEPDSPLAAKLACGPEFLRMMRASEAAESAPAKLPA